MQYITSWDEYETSAPKSLYNQEFTSFVQRMTETYECQNQRYPQTYTLHIKRNFS